MRLQPLVHVEDMAASVDFYIALGARIVHGARDGDFTLLAIGEGALGLLAHPPNPDQNEGTVELNFETGDDLSELQQRLEAAGVGIAASAADTGFGRQLVLTSPDGLLVKVNQLQPERYT